MEKVKLSILRKWRTQAMADRTLNEDIIEGMSERDLEMYRRGFIGGWQECLATLSLQGIIKIIID